MNMPTKRLTLELPVEQYEFLRKEARSVGSSVAGLIRRLIEDRRNRLVREAVQHEGDPLYARQGSFDGPADLAEDHDRYLYGRNTK